MHHDFGQRRLNPVSTIFRPRMSRTPCDDTTCVNACRSASAHWYGHRVAKGKGQMSTVQTPADSVAMPESQTVSRHG